MSQDASTPASTPDESDIAQMRKVLREIREHTGEECRTTGDVWLALAVHARLHGCGWGRWLTLEHHRAPWLRRVMEDEV